MVFRHLYNLRCGPPISLVPDTTYSYHNIINRIPCAVLHIPATIFIAANLYFLNPSPFHPAPRPSSHLAAVEVFSVSMSLFPFCSFVLSYRLHLQVKSYDICLPLILLSVIPTGSIRAAANGKISFISFFLCTTSPSSVWLMMRWRYHNRIT